MKKIKRKRNIFILLCCIYQYQKFMLSVYKMNHLSGPTSILSYMTQNTVDVIYITKSRYKKENNV